jgi:arginyl-tRNA--protein-N-Asp/Glu arginylyltransferase
MQPFPELVVYDDLDPCPYLPRRTARMPMQLPMRQLSGAELDARLAGGYRRVGELIYRTACPACQACEAIRVLVDEFRPSRTQQRVLRRGQASLRVELGPPLVDARRIELYNRHKAGRGLFAGDGPIDAPGYESFLVQTCCETLELRYYAEARLIGVAVADLGLTAMSAVYCYFDPAYARLSPGTYSVLQQIELCRAWGLRYLYLGYYIAQPCHMTYKANFRPHERLRQGCWSREG